MLRRLCVAIALAVTSTCVISAGLSTAASIDSTPDAVEVLPLPSAPPDAAEVPVAPVGHDPGFEVGRRKSSFDPAKSVLLPELTTPTQEVYRNPDGTLTSKANSAPVRFQGLEGRWQHMDATLVVAADGSAQAKSMPAAPVIRQGEKGPELSLATALGEVVVASEPRVDDKGTPLADPASPSPGTGAGPRPLHYRATRRRADEGLRHAPGRLREGGPPAGSEDPRGRPMDRRHCHPTRRGVGVRRRRLQRRSSSVRCQPFIVRHGRCLPTSGQYPALPQFGLVEHLDQSGPSAVLLAQCGEVLGELDSMARRFGSPTR